ncbi:MAG: hypothetical protein ACK4OK_09170, partial [Thermoflexus sp.]
LYNTVRLDGYPTRWAALLALALIIAPLSVEFLKSNGGARIRGGLAYLLSIGVLLLFGMQRAIAISSLDPQIPLRIPLLDVVVDAHQLLLHILLPLLLFIIASSFANILLEAIKDVFGLLSLIGLSLFIVGGAILFTFLEILLRMVSVIPNILWTALDHLILIIAFVGRQIWNIGARLLGRRFSIQPINLPPPLSSRNAQGSHRNGQGPYEYEEEWERLPDDWDLYGDPY